MKYAVVDSGPIIRGARLDRLGAENLVTIPEVLSEIRDKHARQMLETMPAELNVREPSSEAVKAGAPWPALHPALFASGTDRLCASLLSQ